MIFPINVQISQDDDWFSQFKPYVWKASGEQVRMKAIVLALESLPERRELDGFIRIQTRFQGKDVVVRLTREVLIPRKGHHEGSFESWHHRGRYRHLPLYYGAVRPNSVSPQSPPLRGFYDLAAASFYKTASETLSDSDPRWVDFFVKVSKPASLRLASVEIFSDRITSLGVGLDRGCMLLCGQLVLSPRCQPLL